MNCTSGGEASAGPVAGHPGVACALLLVQTPGRAVASYTRRKKSTWRDVSWLRRAAQRGLAGEDYEISERCVRGEGGAGRVEHGAPGDVPVSCWPLRPSLLPSMRRARPPPRRFGAATVAAALPRRALTGDRFECVMLAESARAAGRSRRPQGSETARVDAALGTSIRALHASGVARGATVLIGVSGGQDSLCLAHALWRLQATHGWALRVVHVDHGIRAEAALEGEHVAATCGAWGVPVAVVRADVPGYQRRERLNVQEAARYVRYQAFAREAAARGAGRGGSGAHGGRRGRDAAAAPAARGGPGRPGGHAAGADVAARCTRASAERRIRVGGGTGAAAAAGGGARGHGGVLRGAGAGGRGQAAGTLSARWVRSTLLPALEAYNPAVRRGLAATAAALARGSARRSTAGRPRCWRGCRETATRSPFPGTSGRGCRRRCGSEWWGRRRWRWAGQKGGWGNGS